MPGGRTQDMHDRETTEIERPRTDRPQATSAIGVPAFFPRLWMIMIPLSIPFLMISFDLFGALERTGPVWALCAAPLMSATITAYVVLLFVLKKSNV